MIFLARIVVVILGLAASLNEASADAWDDAYSPDADERFIPIELWTGMAWNGSRDLLLSEAIPNENSRVKISGPEDYTRPNTGERLKVYRRVNKKKVQLYSVTSRKDGLGRVFDNRYNRNCVDEVKFPLGIWRQGESRNYRIECETRSRTIRMTIEEIDFSYGGVEHSLKFRWVVDGGYGKNQDNSYIFSPNRGIVRFQSHSSLTSPRYVALPKINNNTIAARIIYIENPRFPSVSADDLRKVVQAATVLVKEHFAIKVESPVHIPIINIDDVFIELVANKPPNFVSMIGDFRNGKVDWEAVRKSLVKQIGKQQDPLAKQIEFARPYLIQPLEREDLDSFSRAVVETFKSRLHHWTVAKLDDGHPVIGEVPGRPDLPLNEYGYWTLMAKRGVDAEIILTNQLVASVEYIPIPVHTSIRGGITGGSTEYNPSSRLGSSVWVSLFPYFSNDPHIREFRNGDTYSRDEALSYAGAMLAHEMGHQLLQLGHPWSNEACPMRPAEVLDFASWVKKFNAEKCRVGSSPAMTPRSLKIPVW